MLTKDWGAFREWANGVRSGMVVTTLSGAMEVVNELLDEIENLHNRYAHEGGRPQLMTLDILFEWMGALKVPKMVNTYQSRIPNVFTADFDASLKPSHIKQMNALGFTVVDTDDLVIGQGRYMLQWNPPPNDESL